MRRGVLIAAAALLTVAAILGVLAFFSSRDDSTIGGNDDAAPGQAAPDVRSPSLGRGNVVLRYSDPSFRAPLRDFAADFGPQSLHEQGQAVIVERDPSARGVLALAYKRRLQTSGPGDPALREFVEYWLGRRAVP